MRRTLVSRKARKRRIAENAEMSGENYYNRQNAATAAMETTIPVQTETKEAMITGSPADDAGPTFATFRTNTRDSDDDRTPLNSRTPMGDVPAAHEPFPPSRRGTPYRPPQDDNSNLPPSGPYGSGPMRQPSDPRLRPQYSDGSMGSRGGGGPQGFGPRGRGGYPPRGGYGRGGPYMGPPRGPPGGPPGGRGGYIGPPRGRGGMMPGRGAPRGGGGYGYTSEPSYGFDSYGRDNYYEPQEPAPIGPVREPSPGPIGMAVSPEIIGQAIEMQPQPRRQDFYDSTQSMGHDAQTQSPSANGFHMPLESPSSAYSRPEYVYSDASFHPPC